MTFFSDTTPQHIIFARMGRDLEKVSERFKGPQQAKFHGTYNYDTQIYDGDNHLIAACNLAGEGKDFTAQEREIARTLAICADFCDKYYIALQEMIEGKLD